MNTKCRFAMKYPWDNEILRYVRVFEACFVDPALLSGKVGSVKNCLILPDPMKNARIAALLGENFKRWERIITGKDLFTKMASGRIIESEYYQLMMADIRRPDPRAVIRKAKKAYKLYKIFRDKGLDALEPPLAINYCGYQHNRDGTHRRMALYALGYRSCPTLMVRFEDITKADLNGCSAYIKENFEWFRQKLTLNGKT